MAYGGPHHAGHIVRFLSRALRPLTHVSSHADLARLQMEFSVSGVVFFCYCPWQCKKKFLFIYLLFKNNFHDFVVFKKDYNR